MLMRSSGLNTVKWSSPEVQAVFQSTNNNTKPSGPSVGKIVGGAIGAVVGVAILGVLAFYYLRKRRRSRSDIYGGQGYGRQAADDKDQGVETPLNSAAPAELLGQEVPGELEGDHQLPPPPPQELPADVPQQALR